jgi:hypothetical protein
VPSSNKRIALAAALAAAACGDNPAIAIIPVRLEITPASDTVYVGEIVTPLRARAFNASDEEIPDAVITWTSSMPAVAPVDSLTGTVTGTLSGSTLITARAGSVADTAVITVFDLIQLRLPYDTLFLAPGDTFTVPFELALAPGIPQPTIRFGGGAPGIASIDSLTGFVTAGANGATAYVVRADSMTVGGLIGVVELSDTLNGGLHLHLSGAAELTATLSSRAFNHPTEDNGTLFQLRAVDGAVHELDFLLIDSLEGPGSRVLATVPPNGLGSDPVCHPPASFAFYRRTLLSTMTALSLAFSTVTVTTDVPIGGGRAISGRFDVTLQRTDDQSPEGRIRARGTFVVPLISLADCP